MVIIQRLAWISQSKTSIRSEYCEGILKMKVLVNWAGTENVPPLALFHHEFQIAQTLNFQLLINMLVCHQTSGGFDIQSDCHGNSVKIYALMKNDKFHNVCN